MEIKTIEYHYSLKVAFKVADELMKIADGDYSWSNCREQGLYTWDFNNKKAACWAQNRITDDIVIYYGNVDDFDITTHQPQSEEVWYNPKFFGYGKHAEAAKFIAQFVFGVEDEKDL